MTRFLQRTAPALLAAATAACAAGPPAVEFTTADRAAIESAATDALAIANSPTPDWSAYTDKYYAEDAWVHMDGAPTAKGRAAIVELFNGMTGYSNFRFEALQVDGYGDLAYVAGRALLDTKAADMTPVTETYRYVEVWRRQADGSWKVIQDIANREPPVAAQ